MLNTLALKNLRESECLELHNLDTRFTQEQRILPYQHDQTEVTTLNQDQYSHINTPSSLQRQSDCRWIAKSFCRLKCYWSNIMKWKYCIVFLFCRIFYSQTFLKWINRLDNGVRRIGNISAILRRRLLVKSDQFWSFPGGPHEPTRHPVKRFFRAKGVVIPDTGHH